MVDYLKLPPILEYFEKLNTCYNSYPALKTNVLHTYEAFKVLTSGTGGILIAPMVAGLLCSCWQQLENSVEWLVKSFDSSTSKLEQWSLRGKAIIQIMLCLGQAKSWIIKL